LGIGGWIAIDRINERVGDGAVKFAAEGIKQKPVWKTCV